MINITLKVDKLTSGMIVTEQDGSRRYFKSLRDVAKECCSHALGLIDRQLLKEWLDNGRDRIGSRASLCFSIVPGHEDLCLSLTIECIEGGYIVTDNGGSGDRYFCYSLKQIAKRYIEYPLRDSEKRGLHPLINRDQVTVQFAFAWDDAPPIATAIPSSETVAAFANPFTAEAAAFAYTRVPYYHTQEPDNA